MTDTTIWHRQFFVQRSFQGQFIAIFFFLALLTAAVTAIVTGAAADKALADAMFRAHFSERSTGEILLPVLWEVNLLVAATATLVSILVAVLVFRRSAARLDHICGRLVQWEAHLAELENEGSAPPCPDEWRGWTVDLERALVAADESLHARYRRPAERAARLADAARRCQTVLAEEGGAARAAGELDLIRREIAALDQELSRFQR